MRVFLGEPAVAIERWSSLAASATLLIPPLTVAIVVFGLLSRRDEGDRYPRCRCCGYILVGLSESYCPKCGSSSVTEY